jgi:hypothetical protein
MGRVYLLLLPFLTACALAYPPSDPNIQPPAALTHTQFVALLSTPVDAPDVESPFDVSIFPPLARSGQPVTVLCHIPPSWGALRVAIVFPGLFSSDVPALHNRVHRVEHVPCGQHEITCLVLRPSGNVERRSRTLDAGDCQ